jgi:AraC family transcriptional regulator
MIVHARHLVRGGALVQRCADEGSLIAVYGEGGGCSLDLKGESASIWIPLRGSLHVHTMSLAIPVHAGEALVTEPAPHVRAFGHANARWLSLSATRSSWRHLLASIGGALVPDPQLLPERHKASRPLRQRAIELVRSATAAELEGSASAIVCNIAALQEPLVAEIARCPGRTYAKRRQVFLRLQRVRSFMGACCDREIDNAALASMANYSPCHFLRIFNLVYGETPHEYLVNQRLRRARHLLCSSDLAITEVAFASGFENRSAFSRLFRQRFGTTAQELKRNANRVAGSEVKVMPRPRNPRNAYAKPATQLKAAYS